MKNFKTKLDLLKTATDLQMEVFLAELRKEFLGSSWQEK